MAALWQAATVHFNYNGNWTAVFCTGELLQSPPELASENLYKFPNSYGYDGQFYHYQAHDPFFRRGMHRFMDAPRLRYRRMFMPTAAWLAALGRDEWIDRAYIAVVLACLWLGIYWTSTYFVGFGRSPWWGLLFLAAPSTLITLDRMLVDLPLLTFTIGLISSPAASFVRVFLLLAVAALTRETGLLLALAWCLHCFLQGKRVLAILAPLSLAPAVAWYLLVHRSVPAGAGLSAIPEWGFHSPVVWLTPTSYDLPAPTRLAACLLDYSVVAGCVLALAVVSRDAFKRRLDLTWFVSAAFSALLLYTLATFEPGDPYFLPRIASPLLVSLAVRATGPALIPLAMATPRILLQLAPQGLGVARGFASWFAQSISMQSP